MSRRPDNLCVPALPPAPDDTLFYEALQAHREGRLDHAQAGYEQLLARAPAHADALHLLGVLQLQRGDAHAAARLIRQALVLEPDHAHAHSNLGAALLQQGAHAVALQHLDAALALMPDHADAANNRGSVLLALGRDDEALHSFEHALVAMPAHADASFNRGVLLARLGRLDAAQAALARSLALQPARATCHLQLGMVLARLGQPMRAVEHYSEALRLQPDDAQVLANRAAAWGALQRWPEALADCARAQQLQPGHAAGWNNEAAAWLSLQQPERARTAVERALALDPGDAAAWSNFGQALAASGQAGRAAECFDRAVQLQPQGIAALDARAAWALTEHRWAAAVADCDIILRLNPAHPMARARRLHALGKLCRWDGFAAEVDRHLHGVSDGVEQALPFSLFALTDDPALQRNAAAAHAALWLLPAPAPASTAAPARTADHRLRIGWLSGDYRPHPVAHLMAHAFASFDRARFATIALSTTPPGDDPVRQRLRGAFDQWLDLHALDDERAAARVRELRLDIVVDLCGFTRRGRLGILLRRPAPLQVAYLAYTGTLGCQALDYLLADATVVPPEAEAHFAEHIVRLPGSFWCYDDGLTPDPAPVLRAEHGLPQAGFVFCCFCDPLKITPQMFALWMRLMRQRPGSVLWLMRGAEETVHNLQRSAEQHHVAAARLVFAGRLSLPRHLARHGLADLFLDTFPFNAHTTAADALRAGLPLLTLQGRSFASRVASSHLLSVGLPELVTTNAEVYEARALELSAQPAVLAALRARLAHALPGAASLHTGAAVRRLQAAFVAIHERQQRGLPPASFDLVM